jgi:hypothetical protein
MTQFSSCYRGVQHLAQSLHTSGIMSKWIVRFGRLGYAAKGLVYIVVGVLATQAAIGSGGRTSDTRDALQTVGSAPFGMLALIIVAAGLLGYAAWRLISAATDAEDRGTDLSGLAIRAADAVRGLAYGSLGVWTLRYLMSRNASNSNQPRSVTRDLMGMPAGRWLVIAAGAGIIGYGFYQIYRAISGKFLKRLDLSSVSETMRSWIERFGKFGIAARAIVFGMIGVLVVRAGWTYDPSKAGGIKQSLDALSRQPRGGLILGLVAIGLVAFGLFQLATGRYRVMRAA